MKICLVNVGFGDSGFSDFAKVPPLGLLSLAGAVGDEHEVKIIDLVAQNYNDNQLKSEFNKNDIVGINCLHDSIVKSSQVCQIAKESGAITVLGGIHASLAPEIIQLKMLDFLIRGEGEITFKELVNALDQDLPYDNIDGLTYWDRKSNKAHHNKDRKLIENLDDLPFPRYDLLDHSKYGFLGTSWGTLETSRGCSYGCNFCCVTTFYNRSYRTKSIKRVIEEYQMFEKYFDWIFNVDDNYVMNIKRTEALCKEMIANDIKQNQMIQARADVLASNPHVMDLFQKSRIRTVFIGVESIHEGALKKINKDVPKVSVIEKCIDGLHDRGISVFASLIAGIEDNYLEAKAHLKTTIDFLLKHNVELLLLNPIICFPNTGFYNDSVKLGHVKPYNIQEPYIDLFPNRPEHSVKQLLSLVNMGLKQFYFNPKLILTFEKMTRIFKPQWSWMFDFGIVKSFAKAAMVGAKIFGKEDIMADYFNQFEFITPNDLRSNDQTNKKIPELSISEEIS